MEETVGSGYSLSIVISISSLLSLFYVVIIYLNVGIHTDRNHPTVVRQRVWKIIAFTILTLAVLPFLLSKLSGKSIVDIYAELGFFGGLRYSNELHFEVGHLKLVIRDILQTLTLVSLLYVGPLTDKLFFEEGPNIIIELFEDLKTIHGVRDLIVGPVTEEIIYTAAIIVTLNQAPNATKRLLLLLPPALFSFAHFHHAYQLFLKKTPWKVIVFSTVFQLVYTFLFGVFTNFIFLRTDNLYAVILSHSFCNFFGVPKFNVSIAKFAYWNYIYYALLVLGICLFHANLFDLSESSLSLVEWSK